ncbi:unnamed protein product [Schistosoma bovis]|nr:unnamed protein product [Schistosoma bovis]
MVTPCDSFNSYQMSIVNTEGTSAVSVIFHFDKGLCKTFNNSVVRQKSVMKSYGNGQSVGFADEVVCLDGDWKRNTTIGFLHFDSAVAAQRWLISDPIFRQHDWLDDAEIWIVPLCTEIRHTKKPVFIKSRSIKIGNRRYGLTKYKLDLKLYRSSE